MELAELELVPRVEDAPSTAIATKAPSAVAAPLSIKDAAIAHLRAQEPAIVELAERYRAVAFDMSTTKGLAAAKAARLDLRENGRFAIQRGRDATKDLLNDAKENVEAEAERLIGLVKPVEDNVHAQIEVREAAIKAEKEREAARKRAHEERLTALRGHVAQAQGLPAARIANGIVAVESIIIDPEHWEEFFAQANEAKDETLARLRALLARTQAAEEEAAERERQRVEQARIAAEQRAEAARLKEAAEALARQQREAAAELARQAAALERQRAELLAAQEAAKPAPASEPPAEPEKPASAPAAAVAELAEPIHVGVDLAAGPDIHAEIEVTVPATPPAAVEPPLPATPLRTIVHKARPLPEDKRLTDAAALARKFGAEEFGGVWSFFATSDIADLIDAARAA